MDVLWFKSSLGRVRPAPLGGGRLFLWGVDMTRRCVSTRPDFRLFPLFCALFFPLLAIVPAPAAFLSPLQGLAL
jgi:hypothetical protein